MPPRLPARRFPRLLALVCGLVVAISAAVDSAAAAGPLGKIAQSGGVEINHSADVAVGGQADKARAALELYRRDMAPQTNPSGAVRTVLYPMGGADISSALAIFDGPSGRPDRIIIVDALPFGAAPELVSAHQDAALKHAFLSRASQYYGGDPWGKVPTHGYIFTENFQRLVQITGPAILWELEALGATNLEVRYLTRTGRAKKAPVATRITGRAPPNRGPSYTPDLVNYDARRRDVVEVEFTVGAQKSTLLYIQHDLGHAESAPPILRDVLEAGIDAYLEKAPFGPIEPFRALAVHALNDGGVAVGEYLAESAKRLPLMRPRQLVAKFGHATPAVMFTVDVARRDRSRVRRLWRSSPISSLRTKAAVTGARSKRRQAGTATRRRAPAGVAGGSRKASKAAPGTGGRTARRQGP